MFPAPSPISLLPVRSSAWAISSSWPSSRQYDTTDYTEATASVNLTVTPSINYSRMNGSLYRITDGQTLLIASSVGSFAVTSDNAVVYLEQDGTLFEQAVSGDTQVLDRLVDSFQLMPNGQISVVDWFANNLTDPAICNLARTDFTRDEAITYSDMLGLFNQVLQGGPETDSEAQDLRTIVAGTRSLNLPVCVYDLANKVVNPGNADLAYLASYYSGDQSISTLQELVNQWFLGTVQPNAIDADMPASRGDVAYDPTDSYTFPGATGYTLFGASGPEYWDVAQGSAGDCWLLAALAETAAREPAIIQNMFISNGNGTWTVRFYANGAIDYVTVNDQLPLAALDPSYNGGYAFDAPQNRILWAALAEKAFAEENLTGQLNTSQPGIASYAALNSGDASVALPAITGWLTGYSEVTPGVTASEIAADLKDGVLVCINTPSSSASESHLVPDHCYAIVGYNPSSSMPFELFNPWGINTYSQTDGKTYGYFVANGGYLEANFTTYAFAASAAPGFGSQGAVPASDSSTIDASPGQTIAIGLAPTIPSASIANRHGHLELCA